VRVTSPRYARGHQLIETAAGTREVGVDATTGRVLENAVEKD
jgi:hypothetical protein